MKLLNKKSLSLRVLCLMVIALMAAGMVGCGSKVPQDSVNQEAEAVQESEAAQEALPEGESSSDVTVLGEGAKQFSFTVVDKEGQETNFEIHTDKEIVGEALLELGLPRASAAGHMASEWNGPSRRRRAPCDPGQTPRPETGRARPDAKDPRSSEPTYVSSS